MHSQYKINSLKKLLAKAKELTVRNSSDAKFKTWKNLVERTLLKIFGEGSPEVEQFQALEFFYNPGIITLGRDYSSDDRRIFDRDMEILLMSIKDYIDEFESSPSTDSLTTQDEVTTKSKIFISHSTEDASIVEEIIDLLETIGIPSEKIFCTSFSGYGIELGENYLDALKYELTSDTLVLFVLSKNFYDSPICLCEMGATWVLAKEHIPILVPPMDYVDVKGVIPLTEGFKINEPLKMNLFKEKIENLFDLNKLSSTSTWERKRDRILRRIGEKIAQ